MDWNRLKVFHAVAEAGSFTRAGELLNLSQSAISRQISALEGELGTPLFHRHARGLSLTEQGDSLYRTAHEISAKLAMTEAVLGESRERPTGKLKITTTVGFGSTWLTPRIGEFLELYPEVTVDVVLDDRLLDLSMREADIAIRMRPPTQADLVQRRLLTVHNHLYASPTYLKRHGTPRDLADLQNHRIITYGEDTPPPVTEINWLQKAGRKQGLNLVPVLTVNNVYGLLLAVESDVGVASLPDYMITGHSNVVRVLPDVDAPSFDTFLVYPDELRETKKISVFRDFLLNKVAGWRF
ncbi:MAG: LysR family transcriptional regulator [Proteobacteria bacterium]|nr:LysR family transcriptional regulator [Pseudomonadota bacterium]MDA1058684.1 LysR family transcriptional regulator [Pseudomonadota bacterium]